MSSLTSEFSKEEIQHSACAQQSHVKFVLGNYEIITFLCTKYISVTMRITCYGYLTRLRNHPVTLYIYIYTINRRTFVTSLVIQDRILKPGP